MYLTYIPIHLGFICILIFLSIYISKVYYIYPTVLKVSCYNVAWSRRSHQNLLHTLWSLFPGHPGLPGSPGDAPQACL